MRMEGSVWLIRIGGFIATGFTETLRMNACSQSRSEHENAYGSRSWHELVAAMRAVQYRIATAGAPSRTSTVSSRVARKLRRTNGKHVGSVHASHRLARLPLGNTQARPSAFSSIATRFGPIRQESIAGIRNCHIDCNGIHRMPRVGDSNYGIRIAFP